jgi:[acyl-carrier-protein] S-malonyltransferase
VSDPAILLLSDADGAAVKSGSDWLERIVTQVSAPVRWDQCMQTMAGLGASALIELPPGGTLTGLARRALPQLSRVALKTPDDLDSARSLLAEHGTPEHHEGGHTPEWRLLVAAQAGTFRAGGAAQDTAPGTHIRPGAALGHIQVRGNQKPVTADFAAVVLEWVVEDGDPVGEGQPLVRLQPEDA